MFQDIRYTLRQWARRPWQTGFAIVALAIGIGANTGVFGVVNALLLRSLPFREPDRLAVVHEFIPPHDSTNQFHEWTQQSSYLAESAIFEEFDVNLGGVRRAARVHVAETSWNLFSVLGTQPVLGRGFASGDEVDGTGWGLPGRNAAAVIGYGLWQQLFGTDPNVLGSTIQLDGHPLTVIGVAPPGFDFPGRAVVWKPAAFSPGNNGWTTVGRLKPGISWPQARAAFAIEMTRQSVGDGVPDNVHPSLMPLQDALAGPARNASLMFLGAVVLVLLIACTNVANIVGARNADRISELSIRSALGASGARLTRQLFTECLLLSLVATLAGLGIAYWITSFAAKIIAPALAAQSYSITDVRVLGFTVVISVGAALISGMLPLLYVGRVRTFAARSSDRPGSRLPRELLIGVQVMLTIVLFAGSVSLGRAFVHLMKIDRGYDVNGVITASVSLDGTIHQADNLRLPYFEEVLDRLRKLPGVRSASATEFLPLYANAFVGGPFGLDGHPAKLNSTMVPILSGYFQTMGGSIVRGREFTDAEVRSGARVAVVNERFAAGFGASEDAVGHQLTMEGDQARRIVGVVRGMAYETDPTLANSNQVFVPANTPGSFFSTFVARVDGEAEDRVAEVREAIQSVDPQVPIFGVRTMKQRLDEFFVGQQFYRTAVSTFAGFALLLAVIGIYAIVSYAVAQRMQEMGIRLALGTTSSRLRSMLWRQGLLTVVASALFGVAGAQVSGRLLENLIDGARPVGMGISVGLVVLIALVASVSIWIATRRISGLDVVAILRSE